MSASLPDQASACAEGERPPAQVAILMGTWQGEQYLAPQLDSFLAQQYPHWRLWVSDDGSTDGTLDILRRYQAGAMAGRLQVIQGPARGLAPNFLSLACRADILADYYAFSDQDDIWAPAKLSRALAALAALPPDVPALYASRTQLVDSANRDIGASVRFQRPPGFGNALVQNIGGGNTMVFNQAARRLLCLAGADVDVLAHDWWVYMLVAGCGGRVYYDDYLALRYRQHGNNLMGSNLSLAARWHRVSLLWQGDFYNWNTANIAALQRVQDHLTPSSRQMLNAFAQGRDRSLLPRLWWFARSGLYRQTLLGNLGLLTAALLGRL
ncbi:glycosyltransferase family 2 protein [Castellaniella sp.]|uniref:glycosyltransferase family 2 protein n=1 Tax=Castellaniella sp. TaxID=1955812 RepID=UPI002AFFCE79|nr:glycosyltransferase family 2 protein [Castellaniella sp.]